MVYYMKKNYNLIRNNFVLNKFCKIKVDEKAGTLVIVSGDFHDFEDDECEHSSD